MLDPKKAIDQMQSEFQAGAASRDAEVAELQKAIKVWKDAHITKNIQCDQLRTELVKALAACKEKDATIRRAANHLDSYGAKAQADRVREALITTPEQSLAEYRNKMIEAFVNEFSRHVGGDGEFWLHELQDFAMKEQP